MRWIVGAGAAFVIIVLARIATAAPLARCDCVESSAIDDVGHGIALAYAAEVSAAATTTGDVALDTSASVGFTYRAVLAHGGYSTYQILAAAGVAAHRLDGTTTATGVATHAEAAFGPAPVHDGDAENPRENTALFPFTFELVHDGDLTATPLLSARPDLRRSPFAWQRIELTTRLMRSQQESGARVRAAGPSLRKPTSETWDAAAIAVSLDWTSQGGRRLDYRMDTTLMRVAGASITADLFAAEIRRINLPDDRQLNLESLWLFRIQANNPRTPTRYSVALGVSTFPDHVLVANPFVNRTGIAVGRLGWWHDRSWGGIGWQYHREAYATMASERALEDRWAIEAYRTGTVDLRGEAFLARTLWMNEDSFRTDLSGGVALHAYRRFAGIDASLSAEVGRSYYGALDGAAPTPGLAGRATLTLRAADDRQWSW